MCVKKGLPWLTSSKVMFITFLATLRQHWPISEKNLNRGKGLRIWNFQGYQRNSMWSFQGLIKNEVGQFIWSNTILWNIQGLSFFLSRVWRGKVKKWKIPRRDGGSKKYILNRGAVWIFSGIGHFRQIMQSYSSCITDYQHDFEKGNILNTTSNKYWSFFPLSITTVFNDSWFLEIQ